MKAARLYEPGTPLKVEEVPEPTLRPGGAIIKVLSSRIASYTGQVMSGELGYSMPTPFTPGPSAIGVVEAVADDVFGLEIGQKVYCDDFISSKTIGGPPDGILIGWTGLAPASYRMQSLWRDGTYAEKAVLPVECLTPLGDAESIEPALLAYLSYLTIAYGGLLRGELHSGQTLIVNGATSNIGASAVLLALAMGVSKVVAVGRNQDTLEQLEQLDPKRVRSTPLKGSASEYSERINAAAGNADMVIDVLGEVNTSEPTIACINALRPQGIAVFVGGVKADIPLPYLKIMLTELTIRGSFMYPRHVPDEILRMIAAGILDLKAARPHVFPLDNISDAIAQAPTFSGLEYCVIVP